jgi:hypothetical protein
VAKPAIEQLGNLRNSLISLNSISNASQNNGRDVNYLDNSYNARDNSNRHGNPGVGPDPRDEPPPKRVASLSSTAPVRTTTSSTPTSRS